MLLTAEMGQGLQHIGLSRVSVLQWRGLPYGEATFEKAEDIEKAGGAKDIAELHVSPQSP